ncbi:MAG: S9 family peptidase [Planctomycetes bacterium]|nr:S9 family peptidase [Planctomycetota bacterium]
MPSHSSPAASRHAAAILVVLPLCLAPVHAQGRERANYRLAEKYSDAALRKLSYSTSLSPQWIGKSDRFWYSYRTSAGTRYWLVDAAKKTKTALLDHQAVAAAITEASGKAVLPSALQLTGIRFANDGKSFRFSGGGFQFDYTLATHKIRKIGAAPRGPRAPGGTGRGRRGMTEEQQRQLRERFEQQGLGGGLDGSSSSSRGSRRSSPSRSYPPDESCYVYAADHNLYLVRGTKRRSASRPSSVATASANGTPAGRDRNGAVNATNGRAGANGTTSTADRPERTTPNAPLPPRRFRYHASKPVQLSKDGAEDYSFGGTRRSSSDNNTTRVEGTRGRFGGFRTGGMSPVVWSSDSSAFYTTRRDSRGVKELFLVDSLAEPRPSLQRYKYSMPGEESIRTTELHTFHRDTAALRRVAEKWTDESYQNIHWVKGTGELRFIRRDRLLRNVELCALDTKTGDVRTLFTDSAKDGYLKIQSLRVLEKAGKMIWWSERSGWGHYYLYDRSGKLDNAITHGSYRASSIVSIDEAGGWLYFRGNGREPGENIYYEHLYRVRFDGTGLTLLDTGNATHASTLSPSRKFVVDNASRVDAIPRTVLRDAQGAELMVLEDCDVAKLQEVGWKLPETFVVKAADGTTDLYGNMWKPFDFDPSKKYPIILHVYPGPQQEGVTHTFSATNVRQQLAQLGFIVIQVGHRGGTPTRSRAYANYGYYNLRDFGLADKKAAVEHLAMRHPFIDVDRVGIFGHSGGGFMTAAALLQKPYNRFFKVGVASAGNHDNNIYNNSWSERYHGLKEVAAGERATTGTSGTGTTGSTSTGNGDVQTGRRRGFGRRRGTDGGRTEREQTETSTQSSSGSDTTSDATSGKKKLSIHVPTNAELAANLEGKLLLVHGEIDNNVHPANTMRLVDALIKANKRFDMLIIPGARHSFGRATDYFTRRMADYFAEHLLDARPEGADIQRR